MVQGMDLSQRVLARVYGYELLGGLFLEGVTERWLPFLQQLPALAPFLPIPFLADQAAVDHQTLFGFEIFPYESLFLQPDGLLGGEIAGELHRLYGSISDEFWQGEADHLGNELIYLAILCRHENQARRTEQPHLVHLFRHHQLSFLQQHLLQWLPAVAAAIHQIALPLYRQLINLVIELVGDHLADLQNSQLPLATNPSSVLPPQPPPLLPTQTSLKQIANYLCQPSYSGFFLSKTEIARLAQHHSFPQSLSSRVDMFADLLLSAGQYGQMPALFQSIQRVIHNWQTFFTHWQHTYPWSAIYLQIWQNRLSQTNQLLDQLTYMLPLDPATQSTNVLLTPLS